VEQNNLVLFDNHIEDAMGRRLDLPKLALDLPELHANGIKSVTFDLIERFEQPRRSGLGRSRIYLRTGDLPESVSKKVIRTSSI